MSELTAVESYQQLYQRACERKGGAAQLEALLTKPLSTRTLGQLGDDRLLAEFTKKVFQSGFVWRVVEHKWPEFERLFFGFDIDKVLMMPDEMLEQRASDPRIIRHLKKVMSIRDNALMIKEGQQGLPSFATRLAQWPSEDIVGLWSYLKRHGSRLGGNTGPYALRALGKDTFLLSRDVAGYFSARGIISGGLTSKRSLNTIQAAFNQLQLQSGRSLQELSLLIAMSTGDNHRFAAP